MRTLLGEGLQGGKREGNLTESLDLDSGSRFKTSMGMVIARRIFLLLLLVWSLSLSASLLILTGLGHNYGSYTNQ